MIDLNEEINKLSEDNIRLIDELLLLRRENAGLKEFIRDFSSEAKKRNKKLKDAFENFSELGDINVEDSIRLIKSKAENPKPKIQKLRN